MTTHLDTILQKQRKTPTIDTIKNVIEPEDIGAVRASVRAEIYLGETAPINPISNVTIWYDITPSKMSIKYYTDDGWKIFSNMIVAR